MGEETQNNFHLTAQEIMRFFTINKNETLVSEIKNGNFSKVSPYGIKGISRILEENFYHSEFEADANEKIERKIRNVLVKIENGERLYQNDIDVLANTIYLTYIRTLLAYKEMSKGNEFKEILKNFEIEHLYETKEYKHMFDVIAYNGLIENFFKEKYIVITRTPNNCNLVSGSIPVTIGPNSEYKNMVNYYMVMTPTIGIGIRPRGESDKTPYGFERMNEDDVRGRNRYLGKINLEESKRTKKQIHLYSNNMLQLEECIKEVKLIMGL